MVRQLPIFISGNQNKADHLARLLALPIQHRKIDVDEIQSSQAEIVIEHKAKQAYALIKQPVLVDDVSMGLVELDELPGPLIKHFVTARNGLEGICRMADGFEGRRAIARTYYGYFDGTHMTILFGEITGSIADHPRGDAEFAYGWDSVFCPDGYDGRTRAELTQAEYDDVYTTIRPIKALRDFLTD